MILLAHPIGNANVREVLSALDQAGLLAKFVTALGWPNASPFGDELPAKLRSQMARRGYELPRHKIRIFPVREIVRLLAQKMRQRWLVKHERGWASIDRVWRELDKFAADSLRKSYQGEGINAVYGYEDCAERLFSTAREIGVRRIYDLPIGYWETAQRLLKQEAQRYPDWEPTLGGIRDSEEKPARKTRELDLAELVICPSAFRCADIVHLQNASPDVDALSRLVPGAARAYEPQLHTARLCFSTPDKNFGFSAGARLRVVRDYFTGRYGRPLLES